MPSTNRLRQRVWKFAGRPGGISSSGADHAVGRAIGSPAIPVGFSAKKGLTSERLWSAPTNACEPYAAGIFGYYEAADLTTPAAYARSAALTGDSTAASSA